MTITQELQKRDPTLVLHNEGSWDKPFDAVAPVFASYNDAGLEAETGEFMYGLLRVLKPYNVLETGTHVGVGASYLGIALQDNNRGHLDTVEFLPNLHLEASMRVQRMGLENVVTVYYGDVAKFDPAGKRYQFILLDTEPQTRFAEFAKFWDYLDEGGYLFIHDLHRHMHQIPNEEHGFAWPFGLIPDYIKNLVKEGKARPFHFPTPRGLTGFYKVAKGDYVWQ